MKAGDGHFEFSVIDKLFIMLFKWQCFFCSLSFCTHSAACEREKWWCCYRKDSATLL